MKLLSRRLRLDQLEDRTVPSSPGDVEWLRQFGSTGQGSAVGRAVDADGNVYVAGQALSALPGQTLSGFVDAFVRKYDAAGTELWTRQFGGAVNDGVIVGHILIPQETATAVAVYGSAVYVAGWTHSTLPGHENTGVADVFVRKYDADGNEVWTRQFGTAATDQATSIAVDATGVYAGGTTTGALPGQTHAGHFDAFVRKYDHAGLELWTHQFGAAGNISEAEGITGVAADGSGVYVAGRIGLPNASGGIADAFLRKYDAAGIEVWTRQFGTTADDQANGVALAASGVYVAGTTKGTLPGQTRAGGVDAFLRKFDADGTEAWTRQFGTANDERLNSVAADGSGVYVAGATAGALPGQTSATGFDAFVRKYDTAGEVAWTHQFGTRPPLVLDPLDEATGVSVDPSGVYVVGNALGALPGQPGSGGAFVRKYDATGGQLWTRQFGPIASRDDLARAVDADGNVYVAGEIAGSIAAGQTIAGDIDAFVRKYDAAGNELWTRQFGTLLRDAVNAIAVDSSGVYVVGIVGPNNALPGQSTAGNADAFVRKYDASGNVQWTGQFGSTLRDEATGVAVDSSGVYVVGNTAGTLPGQTSSGDQDAFIRKYDLGGTVLWTHQFGSNRRTGTVTPSPSDSATGIAVDSSGIYISGSTLGVFAGQSTPGGQDAFVRRYDGAGNPTWTRQFGTAANDLATGIAAGSSGLYVSGSTAGTFAGETSAGGQDAFLLRMDTAGTALWTRQFGTSTSDQANGVAVGPTGVYVAGFVGGALPGRTSAGGQDAFVRKYDTAGAAVWTGQFGTAAADSVAGVAVGASGLYVAGSTAGAFPGQIGAGGQDAFVAKIVDAVGNTAPSNLVLNLSAQVDENGTATLSGSFTDPDAGDTHTVVIDWGPGEGTTTLDLAAVVTTFTAGHLYRNDSPAGTPSDPYAVTVTVSDAGAGTSAGTSLTVNNLAPTAGVSGPSSGLSGDSLVFTLTATDPSPVDQEAGFTFRIDWDGDGVVDQTVTGRSGMTVAHAYPVPGTYSVRVTAEDQDHGVGGATAAVNVLAPPTVQGLVWVDFNDDGEVNFGESAIPGVTLTLTGTDDLGQPVYRVARTDENGVYVFTNLRPSNAAGYTVAETQPAGFPDGRDTPGTVNGLPAGSGSVNDVFSGVVLPGGSSAENYNFGERPSASGGVVAGQTATIGYWQNRNGQSLILALNGGATATQLGHWLAVTFPNMYGALDGKTNAEVAAFYKALFARTSLSAPGGPPRTDAQVMATALAVYVTNQALAGTTAAGYGFQVTGDGVGTRTFRVGSCGAAFAAADNSSLTVMDLLLAVNARSRNGLLYDSNGDGLIDSTEAGFRTMANDVFSAINEAGDI